MFEYIGKKNIYKRSRQFVICNITLLTQILSILYKSVATHSFKVKINIGPYWKRFLFI